MHWGEYMKIYKGMEIMNVIDTMDYILFNSSLGPVFDNDEHHYRDLLEGCESILDNMMCFMSDDEQSYMFISFDKSDYSICIAMWCSISNSVDFKQTLGYFNCLRNLYKGLTNKVTISANCRTTTSLPVVEKLDGRRGIHVTYIGKECHGFSDVVMVCEI